MVFLTTNGTNSHERGLITLITLSTSIASAQDTSSSESAISLVKLENTELLQVVGRSIMGSATSCSISSLTVLATAVFETIPVASMLATQLVQIGSYNYDLPTKFDNDAHLITKTFGPVGAVLSDVTTAAKLEQDVFKNTKSTYGATRYLKQHFFSQDGLYGSSARMLGSALSEIQNRNSRSAN